MKFRNRAWLSALMFVCTLFSAQISVWAEDGDDEQGILLPVGAGDSSINDSEFTTSALPEVLPDQYNGDVRDLGKVTYILPRYLHMWNEFEEPQGYQPPQTTGSGDDQPNNIALALMPSASANFAGLGFSQIVTGGRVGAGWPPDTNGDVGPSVYIQSVNDAYAIYNKTGTLLAAFTEASLWSGAATGTPCDNANEGDPVVIHDAISDRWILTNFAFVITSGNEIAPFYQCFAVSKTSNPVTGGWWLYAVQMDTGAVGQPPANTLNDYGKFGLWNDGCLYMGANGFNATSRAYVGAIFASFNKANMYAGAALTSSIGFISATSNPFSLFPANLLGTSAGSMPAAGTPEYFINQSNAALRFEVRKFTPGANCGAGGTMSAATNVSQTSYTRPGQNIVPQPGTTNTLDSLGDRLMQKVQYRKIGAAESLWVVHSTRTSTSSTVRPQWAQIDVTGGVIGTTPLQQQIYAPDTTLYRWMPSVAVDQQGNMAIGYSTADGTSNFPSIQYSGRLVGDPANNLSQGEAALVTGGGFQKFGIGSLSATLIQRWGDYSSMSIDPSDDCTFWYTSEYYDTQANGDVSNWQTRIGSFKFPTCITVGTASKLAFTQQPNASYASNATITLNVSVEDASGNVVTTDTSNVTVALTTAGGATLGGTKTVAAVNGVATFNNLTVDKVGTYTLTATDGALTSAVSSSFNITAGAASAISFSTQPVTSVAGATIPVVAHVQDAAGNPISGDNVTLAIQNNAGGSTLTVTANPVATNASGNATFAGVSLNKVGTGYTLKVTDTNLLTTNSNAFNITVGAASAISFSTQPVTSAAGATIPVVAHMQDANGNPISGDNVTLAIQNNAGGSTLTVTTNPVATNASGDATFAGVSLNKVGTGYTLKITDTNLLTTNSNAFNITAGAASAISFSTQPVTSTAGATIPVVAHVQDASGNPISGDAVTLAIQNNAGGSTLTVTTNPVSTNASGDATFAGVSLNKVGTGYTLKVTDTNLLTTNSNAFNITVGAASAISFSTQPVTSVAGATIPVVAHVQDASGNPISGDNVTLAIANNAGGSTLTVTTNPVATNASGNATFAGVSLNKVGTGYTLKVTNTTALTTNSSAFNITAGAASAISFSTQPVTSVAGATIPVVAHVQDASGNPISGDNVTLAIANNAGGSTLTVTTNPVATNASGNATFAGVSLNKVGTGYTLKVTNTTALTTNSSAFNITAGAASAISFSTQPVTSVAGATIPVVAHVQDANGNAISGDNVTLAIQNNVGGSTLTVTTNPVATNASGDATFAGVSLNKVGTGYTLKVTDTNLLTTNSNAFNITVGVASAISFSTQPVTSTAGATIPVVAHVQDANGNPISGDAVTLAIQNNAGGSTLTVTTNPVLTNASGDATFAGVSLNKVGTGYTLKVTDTNLLTTNSNAFNITAGAASAISFSTQPVTSTAGATIPVVAHVQDANGNPISGDAVTLAIQNNAGGSTLTVTTNPVLTNASGDATFAGVSLNKVGTGYTLKVTDTNLLTTNSNAFNITAGAASAISFSTQPVTSTAGATIPVVAHVQDANGNPISGDAVTLAIQNNAGGSTLTVTTNPVATNASGDATFAGVSLNKVGTGYTLKVTDTNLLTTNSNAFNIAAGAASAISFSTQPVTSVAGATIPVVAHVQDANGNSISGDNITLAIANNAGGSTLTVTTNPVVTNASGDATFAGVSLNKVGTAYTLKITDANTLTTNSNAFNITAGAASAISFSTQPVTSVAGATIPVVAHVQDANGNAISGDAVTLAIANNAGGSTLTVTTNPVVTNASGDATFAGVSLNKVGTGYTLKVTDTNLLTTNSNAFNITAGAASAISFSTQPVTSAAGATIPVVAHVQDASGNPISGDAVTLAIQNNAGGSTLTVTTNPVATNASGDATFAGVSLNKVGTGYTLKVTDTNLLTTNSNAFNITAGAATQLVFTTQPTDVIRGAVLGTVAVTEEDAGGNVVPDNAVVNFTITACGGPVSLGNVAMVSGVATLVSSQHFYTLATGLHIDAGTGTLNGTSQAFNVLSGADYVFADGYEGCRL